MGLQLIVGLGNPGKKYEKTRHNAGFWWLDELCARDQVKLKNHSKFSGEVGQATISGQVVRLIKPTTFMNLSGRAVSAIANFYDILAADILVVHDELDLPAGTIRLKQGGGHGGHNGLRDIMQCVGKDFLRLRIGVGHPGMKEQVLGHVLNDAKADERAAIDGCIDLSLQQLARVVEGKLQIAMNVLHQK